MKRHAESLRLSSVGVYTYVRASIRCAAHIIQLEAAHQSRMEIEGRCCLCHEVLPLDRRRKKCLHGNNCIAAKSTIKALLTEPLEEIDALNDSAAAICSNCE